jgi:hypothetical protein
VRIDKGPFDNQYEFDRVDLGRGGDMTAELTAKMAPEDWLPEGSRRQPGRLPWAEVEYVDSATGLPEGGDERVAQSGLSRFADNDYPSH